MPLRLKISKNLFKSTFAHLRYSLGGDRPSQTTYHTVSLKLALKLVQSGIPLLFYD